MQFFSKKIPGYALASTFVALGDILNGFDTGSVGAVTEMPSYIETFGHLSPTMRFFTVSLIMLRGAIPATVAGHLADHFGRLRTMISGAILCTIGCVLECAAFQLCLFLIGRALMGIGQGFALTHVGVCICEIAPSRSRGKFVSLPQFGAAIGVCIGYFSCYGSINIDGDMSWRLPYILQAELQRYKQYFDVMNPTPLPRLVQGTSISYVRRTRMGSKSAPASFLIDLTRRPRTDAIDILVD